MLARIAAPWASPTLFAPKAAQKTVLMDIEEIKTLTDLMVENDLAEIMIRDGEKRIVIRRQSPHPAHGVVTANPVLAVQPQFAPAPAAGAPGVFNPVSPAVPVEDGLEVVRSPMVGTFYAARDPESPPFVKVGDRVGPDSVVCIIEAMKVFNEIKAEVAGTVVAIEVPNASPVEFGQPLMRVRPG